VKTESKQSSAAVKAATAPLPPACSLTANGGIPD
jgi:hypothetical protein